MNHDYTLLAVTSLILNAVKIKLWNVVHGGDRRRSMQGEEGVVGGLGRGGAGRGRERFVRDVASKKSWGKCVREGVVDSRAWI